MLVLRKARPVLPILSITLYPSLLVNPLCVHRHYRYWFRYITRNSVSVVFFSSLSHYCCCEQGPDSLQFIYSLAFSSQRENTDNGESGSIAACWWYYPHGALSLSFIIYGCTIVFCPVLSHFCTLSRIPQTVDRSHIIRCYSIARRSLSSLIPVSSSSEQSCSTNSAHLLAFEIYPTSWFEELLRYR